MPYIPQANRVEHPYKPKTAGELNYRISLLVHTFIQDGGLNYDAINTVIGVLECAKLELYRMVAAPYEDQKRLQNGPVSSLDGFNQCPAPILGAHKRDYVKREIVVKRHHPSVENLDPPTLDPGAPGNPPAPYAGEFNGLDAPKARPLREDFGGTEPCDHAPGGG